MVSKYTSPEPTLMFSIEQPIATPTPMTPVPTSTIQIKQKAQLQVTYEVGSFINDRVTIKVFLKNVGMPLQAILI